MCFSSLRQPARAASLYTPTGNINSAKHHLTDLYRGPLIKDCQFLTFTVDP